MRVLVPEDFNEDNVTVVANTLFVHFANDFRSFIDSFMKQKYGLAWLQDLKASDDNYRNFNPKDPAALLKDLARNGSSKLRIAVNSKIERGFLKKYYEDLDDLLGERNAWLHRQVQETEAELLDLITSLVRVGQPLNLPIVDDCKLIQTAILNPAGSSQHSEVIHEPAEIEDPTPEVVPIPSHNPIEVVETKSEIAPNAQVSSMVTGEKYEVGDVVGDPLLSHSYVLHVTGEIRDRASDQLLTEVNPSTGGSLGALLLARKPSGGRIRITEDGVLCAFFGEKWGYLAQVRAVDWFPGHLSELDQISENEEI